MANYRISDLSGKLVLDSDGAGAGTDDNALILLARSGSHNEKIKYSDFKKTLTDRCVYITGDQTVSGKKTFADEITFLDRVNIHTIVDTTQEGDISGNVFVGESGLFETVGIGTSFLNRDGQPQYTLHVSGDTMLSGNAYVSGRLGIGTINPTYDLDVVGNIGIDEFIATSRGSSNIKFSNLGITLTAGGDGRIIMEEESLDIGAADYTKFTVGGTSNEVMRVSWDSFPAVTVGSSVPIGDFNVTGSAYLEDAYATGSDGEWGRLLPSATSAPPSAGGPGTPGQTAYDNNYFYVCTATDIWKRTPLATW